jgi:hypothetical protein
MRGGTKPGPHQTRGFERNLNRWLRWVAKYDTVYDLGRTGKAVRARFLGEKAKLRKQPAGGKVGPDEWIDIFSLGAGSATSRRDAATPFNGSLAVRALFPNSSLIAGIGGTTHGASLSGNACVDNKVALTWELVRDPSVNREDEQMWHVRPCDLLCPSKSGKQSSLTEVGTRRRVRRRAAPRSRAPPWS